LGVCRAISPFCAPCVRVGPTPAASLPKAQGAIAMARCGSNGHAAGLTVAKHTAITSAWMASGRSFWAPCQGRCKRVLALGAVTTENTSLSLLRHGLPIRGLFWTFANAVASAPVEAGQGFDFPWPAGVVSWPGLRRAHAALTQAGESMHRARPCGRAEPGWHISRFHLSDYSAWTFASSSADVVRRRLFRTAPSRTNAAAD